MKTSDIVLPFLAVNFLFIKSAYKKRMELVNSNNKDKFNPATNPFWCKCTTQTYPQP
jgi:hypothetical protein